MRLGLRVALALSMAACGLLSGCKGGGKASEGGPTTAGSSKAGGSDKASGGADPTGKSGSGSGATGSNGGSADAGVPVGSVKIAPEDLGKAGIRVASVDARSVAQQLSVSGQVVMDEKHTDHIGVLADGQIERVLVLPGDNVHAGQTLAYMHSHMVHETEGALTQAYAAVDRQTAAVKFAETNRDRYGHLLQLQVACQDEAQRADH